MPKAPTPHQVIGVLNRQHVSFVLVGLHGVGGWMKDPRATEDVDLVVAARHVKKAVRALLEQFPTLELRDFPVVARLFDPATERIVIDLTKPTQPLFHAVFKHTKALRVRGQDYRIPSLEMALVLKFAAMINLDRRVPDKYQDAHDFIMIVESNADIDNDKLAELGKLIYAGGGAEILTTVQKVRNGEKLDL